MRAPSGHTLNRRLGNSMSWRVERPKTEFRGPRVKPGATSRDRRSPVCSGDVGYPQKTPTTFLQPAGFRAAQLLFVLLLLLPLPLEVELPLLASGLHRAFPFELVAVNLQFVLHVELVIIVQHT